MEKHWGRADENAVSAGGGLAHIPAYAGYEAQSKCAFTVTTMESCANERAQEEPEHAADYEARKVRMKAFVANEKRPDILCGKDLYRFLRVFIDAGDWWQI